MNCRFRKLFIPNLHLIELPFETKKFNHFFIFGRKINFQKKSFSARHLLIWSTKFTFGYSFHVMWKGLELPTTTHTITTFWFSIELVECDYKCLLSRLFVGILIWVCRNMDYCITGTWTHKLSNSYLAVMSMIATYNIHIL